MYIEDLKYNLHFNCFHSCYFGIKLKPITIDQDNNIYNISTFTTRPKIKLRTTDFVYYMLLHVKQVWLNLQEEF